MENIILKITEKQKENIEKEKQKTGAIITEKITENNKNIVLNKKAFSLLTENGLKITKNYYSYNKTPLTYNAIIEIAKANSDIITLLAK